MVIGAYAAGLAFAGSEDKEWLEREIHPLISLFRPLFFVLIGASISFASVDPTTSNGRAMIALTGALVVVGVLAKMVGPFLLQGPWRKRRAVGFGMVARGGMGFVFADIGMVSGMLPTRLFTAVALTLAATTVIGAVGMRVAIGSSNDPARHGREPRPALE
jgi:Kef-type K+ transport system membrane component KefB